MRSLKRLASWLDFPVERPPWPAGKFPASQVMELIRKDKKRCSQNEMEIIMIDKTGMPMRKVVALQDLKIRLEKFDL